MKLNTIQERIQELFAIFVTQIKGSTSMKRIDINHLSEVILVPILKETFDYSDLRNLNAEHRNYPGIDLADDLAKVAIQVTSTPDSEKIKDTLIRFVQNELYKKYKRLIIYILTEKQGSYSGKGFDKITQGKFLFDKNRDIIDYRDLLKIISSLQLDRAQKIQHLLETNFASQDFIEEIASRPLIEVQRITDPDGDDFDDAMNLYELRIADQQRISMSDIVRGIRTTQQHSGSMRLDPEDYFLVAKIGGRVWGLLYFTYFPTKGYAFLSYLVVRKEPRRRTLNEVIRQAEDEISFKLVKEALNLLTRNEGLQFSGGFVFEVDSPIYETEKKKQKHAIARIERFNYLATKMSWSLRIVEMDYMRPPLLINDECERMMLIYVSPKQRISLEREEAENILRFIYNDVYPDGYSEDRDENRKYWLHLDQKVQVLIQKMPAQIRMATVKGIGSQLH
ncbi:MAG TPA: SMEK domain-containing protein [Pyrinomonadaceae bacterium]|nr:SMEK domain-containing protein [Pyrinomonadaceae bacterium]